jgi:N-methylhydantoinase A
MLAPAEDAELKIRRELEALHRIGGRDMKEEGFAGTAVRSVDSVDLRYRGQSYELTVPFNRAFISNFHKAHERRYGHYDAGKPVEVVNVRATLLGRGPKPRLSRTKRTRKRINPVEMASVWFGGRARRTPVYDRNALLHGHVIKGPAIIGEYSATTLVPPDFVCAVDAYGNLVLREGK